MMISWVTNWGARIDFPQDGAIGTLWLLLGFSVSLPTYDDRQLARSDMKSGVLAKS